MYNLKNEGDEIVSDAYKITEIGNGIAIEVDCKVSIEIIN